MSNDDDRKAMQHLTILWTILLKRYGERIRWSSYRRLYFCNSYAKISGTPEVSQGLKPTPTGLV